jgi:hypothetical protein
MLIGARPVVLGLEPWLAGQRLELFFNDIGGGGGIRTHGTLASTPVFKTGALNRSATPPGM